MFKVNRAFKVDAQTWREREKVDKSESCQKSIAQSGGWGRNMKVDARTQSTCVTRGPVKHNAKRVCVVPVLERVTPGWGWDFVRSCPAGVEGVCAARC